MPDSETPKEMDAKTFIAAIERDRQLAEFYFAKGVHLLEPVKTYRACIDNEWYDIASAIIPLGVHPQYYIHSLPLAIGAEIECHLYLDGAEPTGDYTRILLAAGAFVNALNIKGLTAWDLAMPGKRHNHAIPLLDAAGAKFAKDLSMEEQLVQSSFQVVYHRFDFEQVKRSVLLREKIKVPLFERELNHCLMDTFVYLPESRIEPYYHLKLLELIMPYTPYINASQIVGCSLTQLSGSEGKVAEIVQLRLNALHLLQAELNDFYMNKTTLDLLYESGNKSVRSLAFMVREWGGKTRDELIAMGKACRISRPIDFWGYHPMNDWELVPPRPLSDYFSALY